MKNKKLYSVLKSLDSAYLCNRNVKRWAYSTEEVICNCAYHDRNGELIADECCDRCFGTGTHDFTTVDYSLRNKMYSEKLGIILYCIKQIKEYNLPIKYGRTPCNDYIRGCPNPYLIYFEYLGVQVSFHDPKGFVKCKQFKGSWTGNKNLKLPFRKFNKI